MRFRRHLIILVLAAAVLGGLFAAPAQASSVHYGVDYSAFTLDRLDPQIFRNAGFEFVARYLAPLPNKKVLTPQEADKMSAGGVALVVVWESAAARPLAGYDAGWHDMSIAWFQALTDGMPTNRPVYLACDTDTTWARVKPYYQGAYDFLKSLYPEGPKWHPAAHLGIYAGYKVGRDALASGLVKWFWQTVAWSYGARMDRHFLQYSFNVYICGVGGDGNRTLAATGDDWGQWFSTRVHYRGNAVPPPGSRTLKYTRGQPLMQGGDVSWLQSRLNEVMPEMPPLSGNKGYDVLTKCAVIRFEDKFGIGSDDGTAGPEVWNFILNTVPGERVIGLGNQGPDVLYLQTFLNGHGFSVGKADGIFGAKTRTAVVAYQKARNIQADGAVARVTWDTIFAEAQP